MYRKFFTFTFGLNMIGLTLAASGHFPYAIKYSGAMVVGNLNFAILMRNEIFGRILYFVVNFCFAKVSYNSSEHSFEFDLTFAPYSGHQSGGVWVAPLSCRWVVFRHCISFRSTEINTSISVVSTVVVHYLAASGYCSKL